MTTKTLLAIGAAAAAMVLAAGSAAWAATGSDSVGASATVITPVTITAVNTLAFGNVASGGIRWWWRSSPNGPFFDGPRYRNSCRRYRLYLRPGNPDEFNLYDWHGYNRNGFPREHRGESKCRLRYLIHFRTCHSHSRLWWRHSQHWRNYYDFGGRGWIILRQHSAHGRLQLITAARRPAESSASWVA